MRTTARLLILALLTLGITVTGTTSAAAAPYCSWTLSSNHRLVTVHGPEGRARIKIGSRVFREEIDEGSAVHLFASPHKPSRIHVKAKAFTGHHWHLCRRTA